VAQNGILATFEVDCQPPLGLISIDTDLASPKALLRQLRESEMARMELSRRMINAQEADRIRISRELHDDIGQSLAVLKVQMLRGVEPPYGEDPTRLADLEEFAGRLDAIISKVSRLSHGLHSSALEFLGLSAATKSHCVECAQQLGFPIRCYCEGVPGDLDKTVALAFFRILQEGIHNALKHSQATNMQVKLIGANRELRLEISDDGVGFAVEAERRGTGLGLISMRERACLIGGQCEVCSSPGKGTRIVVRAPIPPRRLDTHAELASR
jgi:signal transduction histidine kinase